MSDGGLFPWKLQKVFQRGPAADYRGLRNPLPPPPDGMTWCQNTATREWTLCKVETPVEVEPELVEEKPSIVVEGNPNDDFAAEAAAIAKEDEWEVLSDRLSTSSVGCNGAIVVPRAGSVRSINSVESVSTLSVPFKIQRTTSSSTIDSMDGALGPSGKGVLGVDYVEHVVMPTDTLQGICLSYKVSSTKLRQANHFSGNSLTLAPKKLIIPLSKKALRSGYIRVQDTDSKEFKMASFQAQFTKLNLTEAKAYLELSDWDLQDAIRSARDDGEWEKEMKSDYKGGEIRITGSVYEGIPAFNTKGAGCKKANGEKPPLLPKPISQEDIPEIASKSVKASDVYKAAHQHNSFGVELQPLAKSRSSD